jgi:hypothetical protein
MVSELSHLLVPGGRLLIIDFETSPQSHLFHPKAMQVGTHLESHGIVAATATAWFNDAGFNDVEVHRFPFEMLPGVGHAAGTDAKVPITHQLLLITAKKGAAAKL